MDLDREKTAFVRPPLRICVGEVVPVSWICRQRRQRRVCCSKAVQWWHSFRVGAIVGLGRDVYEMALTALVSEHELGDEDAF